MIVAFHPELKLGRIIIYWRFAHTIEQWTTLDYFSRKQIAFIDPYLIKMLKDMGFEVSERECINSTGKIFFIESALVKKTLLKWFNHKFKQKFDKIDPFRNARYENQHSINWAMINA